MTDLRDGLSRAGRQAPPLPPDSFERLGRRRATRARRGRVTAAAVSLAIAAVAIGGVLLAFRPHGDTDGGGNVRPAAGMDLSVGPDQYVFTRTVNYGYGPEGDGQGWPLYVDRYTDRTWYRADGSGRAASDETATFFSEADHQRYIQQMGDTPPGSAPSDQTFGPGDFPVDTGDISYLSTDPATLLTQLEDRSAPGGRSPQPRISPSPGEPPSGALAVLSAIQHLLLFGSNATPGQKAALFEVGERLPGVDVVQDSTDPVGRRGILLQFHVQGTLSEYWFDPTSEQLLATRFTLESGTWAPPLPNGTVGEVQIVTAAGVTDSTGDGAQLVKSFVPAPTTGPPAMPDPRT